MKSPEVRAWNRTARAAARFSGGSWMRTANDILDTLPDKVWVSFDIDGLDPKLCPHTGTPVPGKCCRR